jgi:signal transduction histidine kinase
MVPLPNGQTMIAFVNVTDSVGAERMLTERTRPAQGRRAEERFRPACLLRVALTADQHHRLHRTAQEPGIGELNERQAEYLDHISTSSSVLLTIVNDILDLATVDAGIMRLDTGG